MCVWLLLWHDLTSAIWLCLSGFDTKQSLQVSTNGTQTRYPLMPTVSTTVNEACARHARRIQRSWANRFLEGKKADACCMDKQTTSGGARRYIKWTCAQRQEWKRSSGQGCVSEPRAAQQINTLLIDMFFRTFYMFGNKVHSLVTLSHSLVTRPSDCRRDLRFDI